MIKWLTGLCCGLSIMATAFADTRKVPPEEPFATIQISDGWQIKEHPEAIEATSPDKAVVFLVVAVEHNKVAESLGESMQYLRNRDNVVVKPETRHDEEGKVNGMPAHFVSWHGKGRNGEVEMKFVVITLAKNQSLLASYDGSPEANKKYKADLDKTIESITKLVGETKQPETKAETNAEKK